MPLVWDDLRVALAAQRARSHGGAARLLGVDPTTVSRRIAALEEACGARIFARTPAGLVPTDEGLALLARAARVEEEVLGAERELGGADDRAVGTVRITAGDGIVHYVLVPALVELRRAHPGIAVELRADTRALDLSRREADVAIRLARPKEANLVATRFGSMHFALFASRAYLDRRGTPRGIHDLASHDFVGFDASLDDLPQVRWLTKLAKPRWAIRATTTTAQVHACAEGLGIALLGTFVREPRLVPILPGVEPPFREAWTVVHADMRKNARVAAALTWLRGVALSDRRSRS